MTTKARKQHPPPNKLIQPREYTLEEAVPLLRGIGFNKFEDTVDVHMRLGIDPKHADQMVKGYVVMPNGLGKSKRVLVIASPDKQREAREAGADFVGGEDMVRKIQFENWTEFDAVIATPDMMRSVGKLGKILGPRGLMPNPKTGTVTVNVAKAVHQLKAGKVEFRVDKTGTIHARVGKVSFSADKLIENAASLISAVIKAKPVAAKGKYVKSATICSPASPDIAIDTTPFSSLYQDQRRRTATPQISSATAPAVSTPAKAQQLKRYHDLVDRKLARVATADEINELVDLARMLDAESRPSEYVEAMLALSRDRQALLESMTRVEGFLARSSSVKPE